MIVIFEKLENLLRTVGQNEFSKLLDIEVSTNSIHSFEDLCGFLKNMITVIESLADLLIEDNSILISVKHQKLLRSSFEIITTFGVYMCLIPGVGIKLSKKSSAYDQLPTLNLDDQQKYLLLVQCTEFLTKTYKTQHLRNIITTFHLSDYLAALIQLSYAPLKKPGNYGNFVMTSELHGQLLDDNAKFKTIYEELVINCFQPTLMKELLVLQSVTDPSPPKFFKRILSKELSNRLLAPGGVLSLIRCFMECHSTDAGNDWKKNEMLCKIISAKHGAGTACAYLSNVCKQLSQIISLPNHQYLHTALLCLLSLYDKYPDNESVKNLVQITFSQFNHDNLLTQCELPGTVVVTSQEVEKGISVLDICVNNENMCKVNDLVANNLYLLFQIKIMCNNEDTKKKVNNIIVKIFGYLSRHDISEKLDQILFGIKPNELDLEVVKHNNGIFIKVSKNVKRNQLSDIIPNFFEIYNETTDNEFIKNIFDVLLIWFDDLIKKRQRRSKMDFPAPEDLIDAIDERYATVIHLLSEITAANKVSNALKADPSIVLKSVENIIISNYQSSDECVTIALALLSTIISNTNVDVPKQCPGLIPILNKLSKMKSNLNSILCQEILDIMKTGTSTRIDSACEKAISDVFDDLLPVRAHGIIQLTKLIEAKDAEAITKKHYLLCLLQQQLRDTDSYIYLLAINGIAAVGLHCTDEVLEQLSQEYIQLADANNIQSNDSQTSTSEIRMKVGDVIVKLTKGLGEMAVAHKSLLLNTVLCVCRDEDPLVRASALSNLAEIARVLHYKMGSIIYEVLFIIWETIESDKAMECRRAAVLVISSLLKGLGKDTLMQLKDKLLPLYRTLKSLYNNNDEDPIVRLHAQIALEELNDIVNQFLNLDIEMDKRIFMLDKPEGLFK